jgi:hypothetical protein
MFMKSKKVLAASIGLTLALGLAVSAQVQQQAQKCTRQQCIRQQSAKNGAKGANRAQMRRRFVKEANLQRILLPPNARELQVMTALSLTEDQKARVKELYRQFGEQIRPVREKRMQSAREVLDALRSQSPSKGVLQSAADPYQDADRKVLEAEFAFWLTFKKILNPQQQQQMDQMMQHRIQGSLGGQRMGFRQMRSQGMRRAVPGIHRLRPGTPLGKSSR